MTTAGMELWRPSPERIAAAALTGFTAAAVRRAGRPFSSYAELHAWSVADRGAFWDLVWDECHMIGDKGAGRIENAGAMPGEAFFPEARLNFAENLLWREGPGDAIVFRGEDKVERRWSWDDLAATVSRLQQWLLSEGVRSGDRVAAMLPNMPESVALMLAAASIGAIWSSCSPDFGERGILDRFGQIEPVLFIACDGYWYNGKRIGIGDKIRAVAGRMPTVRRTLLVDYTGEAAAIAATLASAVAFDDALKPFTPKPLAFERLPFRHPLYILYSSGTTGIPKCIVHSAGGTLLQHRKEHFLHCDIREDDRVFYFTTCSWMMWNWLVTALAAGATLLLYDGSPAYPDVRTLFDYADAEKMTFFGTSAKFIDSVRKSGIEPRRSHDLSSVRSIASTGSPLSPEGFEFVYSAIKPDVHLASISGGTDIVSCFVLGIPTQPVRSGEIQGPGLGMAVDVWGDDGAALRDGKGELVCTRAFPSMPIGFWNDPDGLRYRSAYFERFEGVWCHGDYAEWTAAGGIIIHGRSDATLNPGGVRIGTAEIYNIVEGMPEIVEAICIGQEWQADVRIVLFVRLAQGAVLDAALEQRIRAAIRDGASPRHVPARIVAVADIPRTKSGKIVELAVREVVHGRPVRNREALANPQALELYANLEALAS